MKFWFWIKLYGTKNVSGNLFWKFIFNKYKIFFTLSDCRRKCVLQSNFFKDTFCNKLESKKVLKELVKSCYFPSLLLFHHKTSHKTVRRHKIYICSQKNKICQFHRFPLSNSSFSVQNVSILYRKNELETFWAILEHENPFK